jgi:hypothetical protein
MNPIDVVYFQGLEKRLAELEAKDNLTNALHTGEKINDFAIMLVTINKRLNEIESQVCGAKKGRMDKLEEKIKMLDEMFEERLSDIEERVKAIEINMHYHDCGKEMKFKQPDGTVTAEHDLVYHPEEHDVKPSGEKKWKPGKGENYYWIDQEWEDIHEIKSSCDNEGLNCFRTRELAESFLSKIKALREET